MSSNAFCVLCILLGLVVIYEQIQYRVNYAPTEFVPHHSVASVVRIVPESDAFGISKFYTELESSLASYSNACTYQLAKVTHTWSNRIRYLSGYAAVGPTTDVARDLDVTMSRGTSWSNMSLVPCGVLGDFMGFACSDDLPGWIGEPLSVHITAFIVSLEVFGVLFMLASLYSWSMVVCVALSLRPIALLDWIATRNYSLFTRVGLFTNILALFTRRHDRTDFDTLRKEFKWRDCGKQNPNHPHGRAAALRFQAINTISDLLRCLKRTGFAISSSGRELLAFGAGNRNGYYNTKDLSQDIKRSSPDKRSVIIGIDVDYYLSEQLLGTLAPHIIMFYTMTPTSLAGKTTDSVWYYRDAHTVVEEINGGATYVTKVWDYSNDEMIVPGWFSYTSYDVLIKDQPGADTRKLVILMPRSTTYLPLFILRILTTILNPCFRFNLLSRTTNVVEKAGFLTGYFRKGTDRVVSMKSASSSTGVAINMPATTYEGFVSFISTASRPIKDKLTDMIGITTKPPVTLGEIERYLVASDCKLSRPCMAMLADNIGAIAPTSLCNITAYGYGGCYFQDSPDLAEIATPPLVTPLVVPKATKDNSDISIEERIVKPRNDVKFPDEYETYGEEFAQMIKTKVLREKKSLSPVAEDDVKKQYSRPGQKARLEQESKHTVKKDKKGGYVNYLKAFMKTEGVEAGKPARNIQMTEEGLLFTFMFFTLSLKAACKDLPWFITGLNPTALTNRVQNFCRRVLDKKGVFAHAVFTGGLNSVDASKADAHVSESARKLYRRIYELCFSEHSYVLDIIDAHFGVKGKTSLGTKVPPGFYNISGAADTTLLNNFVGGFQCYVALRKAGLSKKQAFEGIGLQSGDDSVWASGPAYSEHARKLGFDLKEDLSSCVPAEAHVTFLSRTYPCIYTDPCCYGDVKRALSKISVVLKHKKDGLQNRVSGYFVTESTTPFLGVYLRALSVVHGFTMKTKDEILAESEKRVELRDLARRIREGPYPMNPSCSEAGYMLVAKQLGVEVDDLRKKEEALAALKRGDFAGLAKVRFEHLSVCPSVPKHSIT